MIESRGIRISNALMEFIPATAHIRPLRDHIVVEPQKVPLSKYLAVIEDVKPLRGKVLAVGPGCYPKRYDGPKGKRTKTWDAKCFRPCDVKVGDVVELGGYEIKGYLHTTVMWGLKEVVVCREEDVAVVVDG